MKTILQAFEWYLPNDGKHWQHLAEQAEHLKQLGFSGLWLPPAHKGAAGKDDVGYGSYDLFDLGEFDQKGSIPTKYGSKADYLAAIKALQAQGLEVYADIVFNQMMGADATEVIEADVKAWDNRLYEVVSEKEVEVWTKFTFPGRAGQYDDYVWTWQNFSGVDYDQRTHSHEILEFAGHNWDSDVDNENQNYDYLMGADLDFNVPETVNQLEKWGRWFLDLTGVDGFRLDAVKHIDFEYFDKWLSARSQQMGKTPFVVGEYWADDVGKLEYYLQKSQAVMNLFDVPLHFNLYRASSSNGGFDMRGIFAGTLVERQPDLAVTFVDNHDTQEGQALQSWILPWFREQAYALILLRKAGLPTVFWGDLYGVPARGVAPVGANLEKLIRLRNQAQFLEEKSYLDHHDIIGWTSSLEFSGQKTGLAVLLTNASGGVKIMQLDAAEAGKRYVDLLGHNSAVISIGSDGVATFPVGDGSISVWLDEKLAEQFN